MYECVPVIQDQSDLLFNWDLALVVLLHIILTFFCEMKLSHLKIQSWFNDSGKCRFWSLIYQFIKILLLLSMQAVSELLAPFLKTNLIKNVAHNAPLEPFKLK